MPFGEGETNALELAAVELIIIVAVTALEPVMLTEDGILQPGRYVAAGGEAESAQVKLTAPVNPPIGVTVTIELLPVVEPGTTMVTGVPPTLNGTVSVAKMRAWAGA
jgi:hypothetical protein